MSRVVPLIELSRGGERESVHHGAYVVWKDGEVIEHAGDIDAQVFYRSTSKPLQALVLITSGAAARFGLGADAIALATGSHSGRPEHVEVVQAMLDAIGCTAEHLDCGAHWPFDGRASHAAKNAMEKPSPLHCNCSGKHAAFLAAALAMEAPLDTYLAFDHPGQQTVREHIRITAGVRDDQVETMVDGCSAPTFRVPLVGIARSMAAIGAPSSAHGDLAGPLAQVRDAMLAHPEMVGGKGRFDTDLMTASNGRLISKAGAEGTVGITVAGEDIGLAFTCEDGSDRGYRLLAIETLVRHGWLDAEAAEGVIERQCSRVLRNHAGREVGRVRTLAP